jgi:hypothetical protein
MRKCNERVKSVNPQNFSRKTDSLHRSWSRLLDGMLDADPVNVLPEDSP